jgi:zinc transport system substrate-binding protein
MKKIFIKLILLGLVVSSLVGCSVNKHNIVVTSYPLEFLVKRIAGDRVTISRLDQGQIAQRAQIASDYEDVLKNADVLFYINEAQPYFEIYDEDIKASNVQRIDLSHYSRLYDFKRYFNFEVGGVLQNIEGPYYESDLLEDIDMYESDPMLWIYPMAMVSMGRSILDYLVAKFPDQAKYFSDNFEKLEVELVRLYADYQKLKNYDTISFVSLTPSYGNWQKTYDINVYPLVLSEFGVLPDEDLLNVYRERILIDDVQYIVKEDLYPTDYVDLYNRIKTELDLTEIKLHNLYTLSDQDLKDNQDYITLMYENLDALMVIAEVSAP